MPHKALPNGLYSYTYPPGSTPVEVYVFEDPNDGTCWRFKNNKFSHRLDTSPHNVPIVVWPKCLEPIVPKNLIPTSLPFPANVPCPKLLDPMEDQDLIDMGFVKNPLEQDVLSDTFYWYHETWGVSFSPGLQPCMFEVLTHIHSLGRAAVRHDMKVALGITHP